MLSIAMNTEHGETVMLVNENTETATDAVHLCYQALLALSYSPANVAEAFVEVGNEHCEVLGLNDDLLEDEDEEWVDFREELLKHPFFVEDNYL